MTASINIASTEIEPKTDIRVLGLQIDTKLKWGPHVRKTQEKIVKQSMALTKISTSTWGATFAKARQVYSAVVRPAMTYGSTVWHMPKEVKKSKTSTSKLSVIQNNCLRAIAGAFKATPISVLEVETFIAPIDTHLDMLQAQARYRLRAGGQLKIISSACNKIADKLRGKECRNPPEQQETQVPQLLIHYNFNSQLSLYFSVICAPPELKRSQIECRRALAKLQQSFSAGRTRPT